MEAWVKAVITAIVGGVAAGLTAAVKHLYSRQKQQNARQDAVEDGLRGLLHDRILERYHECETKGYADVHDRENMEALYVPYHTLGGNGTGTDLRNMMRDMPTEPPQTAAN